MSKLARIRNRLGRSGSKGNHRVWLCSYHLTFFGIYPDGDPFVICLPWQLLGRIRPESNCSLSFLDVSNHSVPYDGEVGTYGKLKCLGMHSTCRAEKG